MDANIWTHSKTLQTAGINTTLGSPRSWVHRALGQRHSQDLGQHETSLRPKSLTVAGIWPRGQALPDTGSHPAIYRFFHLDTESLMPPRRFNSGRSMVGLAVAVPDHDIMSWLEQFKQRGAEWTWWWWAGRTHTYTATRDLDHAAMYGMFEQGLEPKHVRRETGANDAAVRYVWRKWQAGLPPDKIKGRVDRAAVLQDLAQGLTVREVAQRHATTPVNIYTIRKYHEQDQDQD